MEDPDAIDIDTDFVPPESAFLCRTCDDPEDPLHVCLEDAVDVYDPCCWLPN